MGNNLQNRNDQYKRNQPFVKIPIDKCMRYAKKYYWQLSENIEEKVIELMLDFHNVRNRTIRCPITDINVDIRSSMS